VLPVGAAPDDRRSPWRQVRRPCGRRSSPAEPAGRRRGAPRRGGLHGGRGSDRRCRRPPSTRRVPGPRGVGSGRLQADPPRVRVGGRWVVASESDDPHRPPGTGGRPWEAGPLIVTKRLRMAQGHFHRLGREADAAQIQAAPASDVHQLAAADDDLGGGRPVCGASSASGAAAAHESGCDGERDNGGRCPSHCLHFGPAGAIVTPGPEHGIGLALAGHEPGEVSLKTALGQ